MSHPPLDPRLAAFRDACVAAGTTPQAIVVAAGLHRTAWFRWQSGKVSPNFRTWDACQRALEAHQATRQAA